MDYTRDQIINPNRTEVMNMNEIPTPLTDTAEFPVMTFPSRDNPLVVRSVIVRDLERCLTIAREALESMLPPGDGSYSSDWWCPSCRELKDGGRVTNSEHCEDCGTFLTPHQNGEAQSARIREALTLTAPKQ